MEKREFAVGLRQQQEWRWPVIIALFFTGIGSGLFLLSLIVGLVPGMVLGIGLVLFGGLFLFFDLSRRQAAWRLFTRPQSSWISRGIIGIFALAALALVYIAYLAAQLNGWTSLGAPWVAGPAWMMALGIVAAVAALFVASYPGYLLGSMRAISFWNSAYIPALFVTSALLGGFGVLYLMPLDWQGLPWLPFLQDIGVAVVVFELCLLLGLIFLLHPGTTMASVRLLTRGPLRLHFLLGVLGLGLVAPLVIAGVISLGAGVASLLFIEGILHLVGVFLLRYVIFRAAIYVPPQH